MKQENKAAFIKGMRNGWPIGVGYFAVAFALGIAARNAGFSALQSYLKPLYVPGFFIFAVCSA